MSTFATTTDKSTALSGNGHTPPPAVAAALPDNDDAEARVRVKTKEPPVELNHFERLLASLVLISWLFLFAGGILVDTKPYRCVISPSAVQLLSDEGNPVGQRVAGSGCSDSEMQGAGIWTPAWPQSWAKAYVLLISWAGAILFFMPLNLGLICATAGTLGAFGGKANLQDESTPHNSRDESNPYISGLLRGFFVYLFMISGLLLFDDKPFSNAGPGQYVRFAGFLSLFSFVVNYQPYLFTTLIEGAFQRISARRGGANTTDDNFRRKEQVVEHTIETKEKFKRANVTTESGNEDEETTSTPDSEQKSAQQASRNGERS